MPYSYSQPSSPDGSVNSGCCEADGAFGIPRVCFCGSSIVINTSENPTSFGRRFYTCPEINDGGSHIWKWCDYAVEEEISMLKVRDREKMERDSSLMERVTVLHELSTKRIEDLTDEFKRLKAEFDSRTSDDLKFMVVGVIVISMCLIALVV